MLNQIDTAPTGSTTNPIPGIKKAAPKQNRLIMALGALVVVLVALAGVSISLRQFFVRETVAPTAPTQSQASVEKVETCSLTFDVAEPQVGASCVKHAYRDELSNTAGSYELTSQKTQFEPGEVVVYSFEVRNTGDLPTTIIATDNLNVTGGNADDFSYQFLDSNCGRDAYSASTRTLTCVAEDLGPNQTQTFTFRIRLSSNIDSELVVQNLVSLSIDDEQMSGCGIEINIRPDQPARCNEPCSVSVDCAESDHVCIDQVCRLESNPTSPTCQEPSPTPSPSPSPSPSPTPVVSPSPTPVTQALCGEYCSRNSDCAQGDHICYFNQCRLATYPDRTNCTEPSQPVTTVVNEPPVVAGCNQTCRANSDCANSSHLCFEGRCRLESYPASTSCTIPSAPDQPKMPAELPRSGSDNLMNWIKVGIGILGAGALLLLL